ncbi:MAG: hypothetical protein L0922_06005 [Candidatus Mariimomonas ferrooxydans]
MAQKLDPKKRISLEEVALAQAIEQEALVNLLVKKGKITKKELLEEIKRLKKYYK